MKITIQFPSGVRPSTDEKTTALNIKAKCLALFRSLTLDGKEPDVKVEFGDAPAETKPGPVTKAKKGGKAAPAAVVLLFFLLSFVSVHAADKIPKSGYTVTNALKDTDTMMVNVKDTNTSTGFKTRNVTVSTLRTALNITNAQSLDNLSITGSVLTNSTLRNDQFNGLAGTNLNATNVTLRNVTITTPVTNATLVTPTVASHVNAQHNHTNDVNGGLLSLKSLGAVTATYNMSLLSTISPGELKVIKFTTNSAINSSNTVSFLSFDENAAIGLAYTNIQIRCYVTGNVAMAVIKNTSAANPVTVLGTATYIGLPIQ